MKSIWMYIIVTKIHLQRSRFKPCKPIEMHLYFIAYPTFYNSDQLILKLHLLYTNSGKSHTLFLAFQVFSKEISNKISTSQIADAMQDLSIYFVYHFSYVKYSLKTPQISAIIFNYRLLSKDYGFLPVFYYVIFLEGSRMRCYLYRHNIIENT